MKKSKQYKTDTLNLVGLCGNEYFINIRRVNYIIVSNTPTIFVDFVRLSSGETVRTTLVTEKTLNIIIDMHSNKFSMDDILAFLEL